jgi:hypothetical protein
MHSIRDLEQRIQDIFPSENKKKIRELIIESVEDENKVCLYVCVCVCVCACLCLYLYF